MKKVWLLLTILVYICGCKMSKDNPQIQWGSKGTAPTGVWTQYDWIIVSKDYYLDRD